MTSLNSFRFFFFANLRVCRRMLDSKRLALRLQIHNDLAAQGIRKDKLCIHLDKRKRHSSFGFFPNELY